ncbi:MAG: hypothetical protein GX357_02825 [Firmicutes bacterium]|nr:hypothetical protein [Bacillota bacterium]
MKKVFVLVIAIILALTTVALAEETTVYVTVSVDGQLVVAAQPVSPAEMTVEGALKAAHAAFYPGGESGYESGIDPMWNMFLISKAWGINATPFVILNDAPLGAPSNPGTADVTPIKAGDNIIMSVSSDPTVPALAISLTALVEDDTVTVRATNWVLDFTTFTYSSVPFANAEVIDPDTGTSLGTTDANGSLTISIPASGIVAINGLAAIPADGSSASIPGGTDSPAAPAAPADPASPQTPAQPPAVPEEDYSLTSDKLLMQIVIWGVILLVPIFIVIMTIGRKQENIYEQKSRKIS